MFKIELLKTKIDYLEIAYRIFGSNGAKQKLLILHGWNSVGAGSWENLILSFQEFIDSKDLQIIAPDLPGFGGSQEPNTVWDIQDYQKFVEKFISFLDLKSSEIALLGHSFGGGISVMTSGQGYNNFRKLILVAPAIIRSPRTQKQKLLQKITKIGKKIFKNDSLKKLWYKLIGSPDYPKTSRKMSQIMEIVIRQDLQYALAKITSPTLIIWGTLDKYTPFNQAKIIQKQVSNSKMTVLQDTNHGVHLNAIKELNTEIKKFLNLT